MTEDGGPYSGEEGPANRPFEFESNLESNRTLQFE